MINKVTMYAAKCDNCGKGWNNYDGICAYTDKSSIEEQLSNDEWHTEKGEPDKHYCPGCWFMDDDDKIQLKQKNYHWLLQGEPMTQLTESLFAVEVPEGVLVIIEDDILKVGELKNITYLTPPGNWQILCTTNEATEEQAKGIVEHEELFINGKSQGILYCNYHCSHDVCEWYKYPRDSLNSLLTSKGLDVNKNYVLLKKK